MQKHFTAIIHNNSHTSKHLYQRFLGDKNTEFSFIPLRRVSVFQPRDREGLANVTQVEKGKNLNLNLAEV